MVCIGSAMSQAPASNATSAATTTLTARQRLRNKLLKNYDKLVHPVGSHKEAVEVQLGMSLLHVDVDEVKSVMSVDAWVQMAWKDAFMTWNPDDYDGLDLMHFGGDELWKPDIMLYNRHEKYYRPT